MGKFRVTYEIVTPESAEIGEAAEIGFVLPGDWKVDIESALTDSGAQYDMGLRSAMALAWPSENCGQYFTEVDGREDYQTGARETRAIHLPRNITAASYGRVRRLLGVRP